MPKIVSRFALLVSSFAWRVEEAFAVGFIASFNSGLSPP